jgi:hypothetical protein
MGRPKKKTKLICIVCNKIFEKYAYDINKRGAKYCSIKCHHQTLRKSIPIEILRSLYIDRGFSSYTPDFKVTENNGDIIYHEVKGWMDPKSKTRMKRMAHYHPEIRIILIGEKEYKALSKWRAMIPNWER